jgi:nitrous oxidase accessory protein NosD
MIRNSRVRRSIQLTMSAFALAAIFASSAMALNPQPAPRYVAPAPAGSDVANSCLASTAPCATIQHAVDQALPGDTIEVAAGTYAEDQIAVDKPLSLHGAGAAQTVVDGSAASGGPTKGLLRFDSPAVGHIAVSGFTFKGANGNNLSEEALTILFSGIPAGSNVEVTDNVLLTNETLDPDLGFDWSLGLYVTNSAAEFEVEGNRFDGMWQGILVERSTGATAIVGNEFTNLSANNAAPNTWPAEGVLVLAIGQQVTAPQAIRDNHFHDYAGLGVAVQAGHGSAPGSASSFTDVTVAGNEIDLQGAIFPAVTPRPLAGVILKTGQAASTIEGADVLGNTVSVSAPGNDIAVEEAVTGSEVHSNRLAGAPAAGLDASLATGPVDAADNWWGCNAGPGVPACVAATGQVDSSPNLVLTGSASAPQVAAGASATIAASLLTDSDGGTVVSVPSGGEPVLFGSALGTVAPASKALLDGLASSTFTAGTQPGDAGVTVSLDGEQVAVPLTVLAPPPAIVVPPPPPPTVKAAGSGAPKPVPGSGEIKAAVVSCPAGSSCQIAVGTPQAKIGGKSYKLRIKAPGRIAAGSSATVKLILPKAAREALEKAGKGKVTVKITVTSSSGATETVTLKIRLVGKKR